MVNFAQTASSFASRRNDLDQRCAIDISFLDQRQTISIRYSIKRIRAAGNPKTYGRNAYLGTCEHGFDGDTPFANEKDEGIDGNQATKTDKCPFLRSNVRVIVCNVDVAPNRVQDGKRPNISVPLQRQRIMK